MCILVNFIQFSVSNTSDVSVFVKKKSRAKCQKTLILKHFLLIFIPKTCLTSLFFVVFLYFLLLKTTFSFNFLYDINPVFADVCYHCALEDFKEAIEREDDLDLYNRFESSRNYRNSMPSSSAGPIKKAFAVYCDIIDEAGGIAAIATILASNNISIKNIGIVHNREFEEGVLRIEFYDEDSSKRAVGLLQKFRYIVYER